MSQDGPKQAEFSMELKPNTPGCKHPPRSVRPHSTASCIKSSAHSRFAAARAKQWLALAHTHALYRGRLESSGRKKVHLQDMKRNITQQTPIGSCNCDFSASCAVGDGSRKFGTRDHGERRGCAIEANACRSREICS
jgi:hypothetical protein